jgi:hypothetical protein
MRRPALLLIGMVAAALLPCLSFGQGHPGFGPPPGFQGAPGPMGPGSMIGGPGLGGPPMMGAPSCPPPVCGPPPCEEEPKGIGVAGYVGYLYAPYGAQFRCDAEVAPLGGAFYSFSHQYPLQGAVVGAGARAAVGESGQVMIKGSWLFPAEGHSREDYLFAAAVAKQSWRLGIQWGNVDASAAYMLGPHAALIGGLRYDSFMTNFKEPYDLVNIPAPSPTDRQDVTLISWVPYLGAAIQHSSCNGSASLGVIGFPHVFGDIAFRETLGPTLLRMEGSKGFEGGYFFEAFAEASRNFGMAQVGAFARWNALHGESQLTLNLLGVAPAPDSQVFRFRLDRQAWIFGGKVSFSF